MTPIIQPELPPLRVNEYGAIRVGLTRVSLDLVIHEFKQGATPEKIVECYDTLHLADVYGAIAFYLRHQEEVEAYLAEQERKAEEIRRRIEARWGLPEGLRERLLERRKQMRDSGSEPRSGGGC